MHTLGLPRLLWLLWHEADQKGSLQQEIRQRLPVCVAYTKSRTGAPFLLQVPEGLPICKVFAGWQGPDCVQKSIK